MSVDLYQGPTVLRLDEMLELPPFEHGKFVQVGWTRRLATDGLESEFWECRMPARFYKAVVMRQDGIALGTFGTGSGRQAVAVLGEICRALASGFATIEVGGDEVGRMNTGITLTESEVAPMAVLASGDTTLLTRARVVVQQGMLSFEVAQWR